MRKKLFAILMSAMMMVTFMPAMAFAATGDAHYRVKPGSVVWGENNTSASATIQVNYENDGKDWEDFESGVEATRVNVDFLKNHYGMIEAEAVWFFGEGYGYDTEKEYFFDLTDAEFDVEWGTTDNYDDILDELKEGDSGVAFKEMGAFPILGIKEIKSITLKQPSYDNSGDKNQKKEIGRNSSEGRALMSQLMAYLPEYQKYDEGKFTFAVKPATAAQLEYLKTYLGVTNPYTVVGETGLDIQLRNRQTYRNVEWSVSDATTLNNNNKYVAVEAETLADGTRTAPVAATVSFANANCIEAVYDAKEHTVAVEALKNVKVEYAEYTPDDVDTTVDEKNIGEYSETAPVVKDAGDYYYIFKLTKTTVIAPTPMYFLAHVKVWERPVSVMAAQLVKEKSYDGEGFALTDEDFIITGLAGDDKLIVVPFVTKADVGTYVLGVNELNALFNTNYEVSLGGLTSLSLGKITKAENYVTCPTTNKTVKYSKVKKAAQKVTVKTTSAFGEVKLTKVSGSAKLKVQAGKIVVKKGTKKGTYKIKVRAYVGDHSANYADAKITKTITIRVK